MENDAERNEAKSARKAEAERIIKLVDQKIPYESLSEGVRNKPEGAPFTNAQALELLRWAQARWDATAIEAGWY